MSNYCDYRMKVKGKRDNVEEFINIMQCNYDYTNNTFSSDRHMWRIFDADYILSEDEYDEEEIIGAYIDGYCAWSVYSCMMEGSGTYYNDHKNNILYYRSTSLIKESERLSLDIEVYSSESGCCFQEHIYISNGKIILNDCVDFEEISYDCYDNDEDAEEALQKLNDKYNEEYDLEDLEYNNYISYGGFGDWEFCF